jgi:hypothetical protein
MPPVRPPIIPAAQRPPEDDDDTRLVAARKHDDDDDDDTSATTITIRTFADAIADPPSATDVMAAQTDLAELIDRAGTGMTDTMVTVPDLTDRMPTTSGDESTWIDAPPAPPPPPLAPEPDAWRSNDPKRRRR